MRSVFKKFIKIIVIYFLLVTSVITEELMVFNFTEEELNSLEVRKVRGADAKTVYSIGNNENGNYLKAVAENAASGIGKEIKINLDKDEHNASIQAISEGYKCPTCGKSLASKYTLFRHRKDVHKENVMTETERQQKNKNCKTSLNKDEKNVEPLTRKYFFV